MSRGIPRSLAATAGVLAVALVILSKLEARSRVQAVVMAYESGLVVPASRATDG